MWGRSQIELWRVPDIEYTLHVRYSSWPTIIDDSMDGSNLDLDNVDDLMIHLAASYVALSLGNMEKSNEMFSIYRSLVKDAIGEDDEDYERAIGGMQESISLSRGYDNPFVKSMGDEPA